MSEQTDVQNFRRLNEINYFLKENIFLRCSENADKPGQEASVLGNLSDESSSGHNKVISVLCSLINIHAEGRDLSGSPLKTH